MEIGGPERENQQFFGAPVLGRNILKFEPLNWGNRRQTPNMRCANHSRNQAVGSLGQGVHHTLCVTFTHWNKQAPWNHKTWPLLSRHYGYPRMIEDNYFPVISSRYFPLQFWTTRCRFQQSRCVLWHLRRTIALAKWVAWNSTCPWTARSVAAFRSRDFWRKGDPICDWKEGPPRKMGSEKF